MLGVAYLVVTVVMLLFALGVSVFVLRDLVSDARERLQSGPTPPAESNTRPESPATVPDGSVRCSNCGSTNDTKYAYCQDCAEQL